MSRQRRPDQPLWKFAATSDRDAEAISLLPRILESVRPAALAADVLQAGGRLRRHRSARAIRPPRNADAAKESNKESKEGKNKEADKAEPRRLFEPPQFPLVLPNARTRNGVGQTVKDLSEDP